MAPNTLDLMPVAGSAKEMIAFIKERFQIRQCKNFKNQDRVCLNYHIKKCLGPCMGYVSKEEYKTQIDQIMLLLEGKIDPIIKDLRRRNGKICGKSRLRKSSGNP